jgi:deoxyribonuclease-4
MMMQVDRNLPLIGAHVSTAGGLSLAPSRAKHIGVSVIQLFVSSPRQWSPRIITETEIIKFRSAVVTNRCQRVYVHASYLINLASFDPDIRKRSENLFRHEYTISDLIGADGLILHAGSARSHRNAAINQVIDAIGNNLNKKTKTKVIIENSAGQGGTIGNFFQELALLTHIFSFEQVGICLDTAHAFAAGYDLKTAKGVSDLVKEIRATVGLKRINCLHVNDTKVGLASHKDRHENFGDGMIGIDGFKLILNYPAFIGLPLILETPGLDGQGPDITNVNRLKSSVYTT